MRKGKKYLIEGPMSSYEYEGHGKFKLMQAGELKKKEIRYLGLIA